MQVKYLMPGHWRVSGFIAVIQAIYFKGSYEVKKQIDSELSASFDFNHITASHEFIIKIIDRWLGGKEGHIFYHKIREIAKIGFHKLLPETWKEMKAVMEMDIKNGNKETDIYLPLCPELLICFAESFGVSVIGYNKQTLPLTEFIQSLNYKSLGKKNSYFFWYFSNKSKITGGSILGLSKDYLISKWIYINADGNSYIDGFTHTWKDIRKKFLREGYKKYKIIDPIYP